MVYKNIAVVWRIWKQLSYCHFILDDLKTAVTSFIVTVCQKPTATYSMNTMSVIGHNKQALLVGCEYSREQNAKI